MSVCLLLAGPVPVSAFPGSALPATQSLKCRTACHLPGNLLRARRDKSRRAGCRECHTGIQSFQSLPPARIPVFVTGAVEGPSPPPPRTARVRTAKRDSPKPGGPSAKAKALVPRPPKGMVFVPAGEFIMGSNERWADESPEYIESTRAFYIDLYEVTNSDYKKFVDATGHEPPYHWPSGKIPKGKENHPVIYVNWFEARDYCQWKGKRLPAEEEWEKAARGADGLIYPWGDIWDVNKSNNPYKNSTGTEPVGSYPDGRSPYGLYDMSGNVWEWVDSFYLPHPGNNVPSNEYGKDKRVLKGGSWFDCLSYGCGLSAPTFNRGFFTPEVRNNSFGFRCAKDAPED